MEWPLPDEAPLDQHFSVLPCEQEITGITEQHIDFEVENSSSTKKRKLKSKVWDEFTKTEEGGKEWATCNHCKKKFGGSSKSGTTHLRNHLERCPVKRNPDGGAADKTGDCLTTSTSANIIKGKSKIDEELNQLDEARIAIKHWGGSLVSLKDNILNIFEEEKQKLMRYFYKLPCRFNVSIGCLEDDYEETICVAVHFIDDNWELKNKVIYFHVEYDRSGLCEKVKCMIKDWNMDKDLCSIVDNQNWRYLFDVGYGEMMKLVSDLRGSFPLAGALLSLRSLLHYLEYRICVASFNSRLSIRKKMISLVEYVTKFTLSEGNNNKFGKTVDKVAAMSMSIDLTSQRLPHASFSRTSDDELKLIEWGVGLKEAFWKQEQMDDALKSINLTEEEWGVATALYEVLKAVVDFANSLSDCKYSTPNVYFPKICHLYMTLLQQEKSDSNYVCETVSKVRSSSFDEYWNNSHLVLAITVVLDPRFKMDIVERWYMEIYGESADIHINKVNGEITNIYREYAQANKSPKTSAMLDPMGRSCTSSYQVDHIASSTQSELDRYLKDSKFPAVEDFDVLAWWRSNSPTYPTLARMARDYLAIPICVKNSLGSSLSNETVNIVCNEDLDDDTKEALVHTKIWLYGPEN